LKLLPTVIDQKIDVKKDVISGLIIAAVSIPIAMGYAQIAGLPAVYGLYGSVLPIIFFALFSTSPHMIFGVDAAPAALTGTVLVALNISAGSSGALKAVPVITLCTACWLLLFSLFHFGHFTRYISEAVMGGFITGIGFEIIAMQVPKLFGGVVGHGELPELVLHIAKSVSQINSASLILGFGALAVLLVSRKLIPKFPMAVVVMLAGAVIDRFVDLSRYGVATLPKVAPGLPKFFNPILAAKGLPVGTLVKYSLTIALVITAETLLSSKNMAERKGMKLDPDREILAYAVGNFAAAFTGCCPVNGSVSRMGIADQFGSGSQLTGLVAGGAMVLILLFGTGFIGYLPVPVLTAIVIAALMGILEFEEAVHLFKIDRREFLIFLGAFCGVVFLGTIYGVVIGVALSFIVVLMRTMTPPRTFLGVIPGQNRFYDLRQVKEARAIEGVVLYRFSANLYFANFDLFEQDIEGAIGPKTKVVIVDATGITSLDYTAAKKIDALYQRLKQQDIRFFLTGHISSVNDTLREADRDAMIREGSVVRTMTGALLAAGYHWPYPLEGGASHRIDFAASQRRLLKDDMEWAFGDQADAEIAAYVQKIMALWQKPEAEREDLEAFMRHSPVWQHLNGVREDDLLEHLEMKTESFAKAHGLDPEEMAKALAGRRQQIAEKLKAEDPHLYDLLQSHRGELNGMLKRMGADPRWKHRLRTIEQWRMRLKAFGHHRPHGDSAASKDQNHTKESE
jgi:high affinity sulfate transporter 1